MKKQTAKCFAASSALLILILDGSTAVAGICEGIDICMKSLIPSLFPFFVCSGFLIGNLPVYTPKWIYSLSKLCIIPKGSESLMILGFLGGYPVGAQNITQRWQQGNLSREDAERMLAFCNNAGPAFLFGIIGPMFSSRWTPWILWAVQILSAVFVAILLPGTSITSQVVSVETKTSFPDVLERSMRSMALVCSWVIFMKMCLNFLERWILWLFPTPLQIILSGVIELSNGCLQLGRIANENIRFLAASGMLAFGGICITLQTCSVTSGLSHKLYFPGKILQTAISLLLACIVQGTFLPAVLIPSLTAIFCIPYIRNIGKRKNTVAFPLKLVYNHLIQH